MPPFPTPAGAIDSTDSFGLWFQVLLILAALLPVALMGYSDYRKGVLVGKRKLHFWIYAALQIGIAASVLNWSKAQQVFHFLTATLGLHAAQILVPIVALFAGWCVHTLRQWSKLYFGAMEIGFGIFSAVVVASTIKSLSNINLVQLVALLSCALVVSRGFTNCREAKDPKGSPTARAKETVLTAQTE